MAIEATAGTGSSRIQATSSGNTTGGGEVAVTSDSYEKLKQGLAATQNHSSHLSELWEEKIKDAPIVFLCKSKGCGRTFKKMTGLKAHWRGKKNQCSSEFGHEECSDLKVTMDDRVSPEEREKYDLMRRGTEAAEKVAKEMKKNKKVKTRETKADALFKTHISKLPELLKHADETDIKKFLTMRFDINNASKQHLGMMELARRRRQGA